MQTIVIYFQSDRKYQKSLQHRFLRRFLAIPRDLKILTNIGKRTQSFIFVGFWVIEAIRRKDCENCFQVRMAKKIALFGTCGWGKRSCLLPEGDRPAKTWIPEDNEYMDALPGQDADSGAQTPRGNGKERTKIPNDSGYDPEISTGRCCIRIGQMRQRQQILRYRSGKRIRIMTCNPMCSAVWCHKIEGSFFTCKMQKIPIAFLKLSVVYTTQSNLQREGDFLW